MAMKQGTIIDATMIAAPSTTKNERKERDPEMLQTCKGKQCYFGMKVHIGEDSESRLIHSVETTSAHLHDLTPPAGLLQGEEIVVYGDAFYQAIEKRDLMQGRGIGFRVAIRPGKRRVLPSPQECRWMILSKPPKRISAHRRASVSGDQTAVRLSEDPTAGNAQEPLQSDCAGRPFEPIRCTS